MINKAILLILNKEKKKENSCKQNARNNWMTLDGMIKRMEMILMEDYLQLAIKMELNRILN
jgi:hypothetical protein